MTDIQVFQMIIYGSVQGLFDLQFWPGGALANIPGSSSAAPTRFKYGDRLAPTPGDADGKELGPRGQGNSREAQTSQKDLHEMLCQERSKGPAVSQVRIQRSSDEGQGIQRRIGPLTRSEGKFFIVAECYPVE